MLKIKNLLKFANKNTEKILLNKYSTFTDDNHANKKLHIPVMLKEVVKYLVEDVKHFKVIIRYSFIYYIYWFIYWREKILKTYLDLTFGAGGHTEEILKSNPNSIVYASDRDPFAFELAKTMSQKYPGRIIPINSKFSDIGEILSNEKNVRLNSIDAALIDCGVSSIQLDEADRGFSLSKEGPLDMRMGSIKLVSCKLLLF